MMVEVLHPPSFPAPLQRPILPPLATEANDTLIRITAQNCSRNAADGHDKGCGGGRTPRNGSSIGRDIQRVLQLHRQHCPYG